MDLSFYASFRKVQGFKVHSEDRYDSYVSFQLQCNLLQFDMIWIRVTATACDEMEHPQHGHPFIHPLFFFSLIFITAGSTGMILTMNDSKVQARVVINLSSVLQWPMAITPTPEERMNLPLSCSKSRHIWSFKGKPAKRAQTNV